MKTVDPGDDFGEIVHIGIGQYEYEPLDARVMNDEQQTVVMRWVFSDAERAAIAAGEDIYVSQMTFGKTFQPIAVWIEGFEDDD